VTGRRSCWQRYLGWRLRHVQRLILQNDGFTIVEGRDRKHISWCDIANVTAYKRDLLTVDLLCLAVGTNDGVVELNEEMEGYGQVEEQLCERLGVGHEWKLRVLFPAFETCIVTLYPGERRDSST
jgi:hypothetical protein